LKIEIKKEQQLSCSFFLQGFFEFKKGAAEISKGSGF
jgi:hypothetical protein